MGWVVKSLPGWVAGWSAVQRSTIVSSESWSPPAGNLNLGSEAGAGSRQQVPAILAASLKRRHLVQPGAEGWRPIARLPDCLALTQAATFQPGPTHPSTAAGRASFFTWSWQSSNSGGIPSENRAKFDRGLIGNVVPSSCLAGAMKCTGNIEQR